MFVTLVATALVGLVSHPDPCRKALPRGPAVPAPIILRTTCGDFKLGSDGKVSRMRRHWLRDWLALHPSSPRYGRGLTVSRNRAGRIFVLRDKKVIWQSSRLYPRDGGAVLFGQDKFVFASYRRGIFLTDLKGPEKLAARGRGLYPFNFTSTGELLVSGPRAITVVSSTGKALRRYRYRQITGYAFDETSDTLFFGTPDGMLVSAHGSDLSLVRPLRGIGGMMSILQPSRLLVFEGERSVFVMRRDGTFVAQARWSRRGFVADSGLTVSPDGQAFVYRLTNVYPGSKGGRAVVYVLHAGEAKAHPVYGHRLGPSGCAVGADLSWHGRFAMYRSTDGNLTIIDTGGRSALGLTPFLHSLPGLRSRTTSYAAGYWASEFGQ